MNNARVALITLAQALIKWTVVMWCHVVLLAVFLILLLLREDWTVQHASIVSRIPTILHS